MGAVEDLKIEGRKNQDSNLGEAETETKEAIFSVQPQATSKPTTATCTTAGQIQTQRIEKC